MFRADTRSIGRPVLAALLLSSCAAPPEPAVAPPAPPPPSAARPDPPPADRTPATTSLEVSLPSFPNSNCPIMGKPISKRIFVDTDYGRIYLCCKGCDLKVLEDVALAYRSAYPRTRKVGNSICPVSGRPIGSSRLTVLLQGQEVALCCPECERPAHVGAQLVLAKANRPALVDVGNEICPITGGGIDERTFVLVGEQVVRLSSPECVAAVEKDPAAALQRAVASRSSRKKGE